MVEIRMRGNIGMILMRSFLLSSAMALTVCLSIPQPTPAQVAKKELFDIMGGRSMRGGTSVKPRVRVRKKSVSELSYAFSAFIRVYQVAISPQLQESCNFNPSCSHYAQEALSRRRIFTAMLLISDRLQRCHGGSGMADNYEMDKATGLFKDPLPFDSGKHAAKSRTSGSGKQEIAKKRLPD